MIKIKAIAIVLILVLAIVFAFAMVKCFKNSAVFNTSTVIDIMKDADNRVSWIKERIDYKWYEDHFDENDVIYRCFEQGVEGESYTTYFLYYDEHGNLIYAEIVHYRSANYSIYFHNDKLLHVEVGPFHDGGSFVNGDISDAQIAIAKDPHYAFILEDLAFCLSHAYQSRRI